MCAQMCVLAYACILRACLLTWFPISILLSFLDTQACWLDNCLTGWLNGQSMEWCAERLDASPKWLDDWLADWLTYRQLSKCNVCLPDCITVFLDTKSWCKRALSVTQSNIHNECCREQRSRWLDWFNWELLCVNADHYIKLMLILQPGSQQR